MVVAGSEVGAVVVVVVAMEEGMEAVERGERNSRSTRTKAREWLSSYQHTCIRTRCRGSKEEKAETEVETPCVRACKYHPHTQNGILS